MKEIQLIDIKQHILSDNQNLAEELRGRLTKNKVFMLNVMASPGAGKTSLIIQAIRRLKTRYRIAVIEGDIDSLVDSEKVTAEGVTAVQIRTGGDCHLDAAMVDAAIQSIDLNQFDLIFLENIGNLVCPAEFDTGAHRRMMILSVPEGDDKILKYPLMFSVCDSLVVNKIDTKCMFDFDTSRLAARAATLNPKMQIFELSSKTGEGVDAWCAWLEDQIAEVMSSDP